MSLTVASFMALTTVGMTDEGTLISCGGRKQKPEAGHQKNRQQQSEQECSQRCGGNSVDLGVSDLGQDTARLNPSPPSPVPPQQKKTAQHVPPSRRANVHRRALQAWPRCSRVES